MARKAEQVTRFRPPIEKWKDEDLLRIALFMLHRNLPATMAVCMTLRLERPEWVNKQLADEYLASTTVKRPRLKKLTKDMMLFLKEALRYEPVLVFAKRENDDESSNIFERAFEKIEGDSFATKDSTGLKKSYYKFQRMFGGRDLAAYMADRIFAALFVPSGGST